MIIMQRQADLLEIIFATGTPRRFTSLLDGGEQDGDQNGDDGNYDQKFNQNWYESLWMLIKKETSLKSV